MTKPICLNLSNGTIVIGVERNSYSAAAIQLENVLLITTTSYVNKAGSYNPQIFLTKYNLFGEDKVMSFNIQSVISKYVASDALTVYYNSFMKSVEDDPDNLSNIDNMNLATSADKRSFLSEFEEMTRDNKIDIENLRNTVYRNNNNSMPEFDDGVYYENDDEDEDDEDK